MWDVFFPPSWTPNTSQCYPVLVWLYAGGWHQDIYNAADIQKNRAFASSVVSASVNAAPNDPSRHFIVALPRFKLANYAQVPASLAELPNPPMNGSYTTRPFAYGGSAVSGLVPTSEGLTNVANFVAGTRNPTLAVSFKQDVNRITIGGSSSAGHVALMEATNPTAASAVPLKCVVAKSAPFNLVEASNLGAIWSIAKWRLFGAFPPASAGTWNGQTILPANSPAYRMNFFNASKAVVIHGLYDSLVPYAQAQALQAAAQAQAKPVVFQTRTYNLTDTYGRVPTDTSMRASHETERLDGTSPEYPSVESLIVNNCV